MHFNYYEYKAQEAMFCLHCNGTGESNPDRRCGICKGTGEGVDPGKDFWREYDLYRYLVQDIEYSFYVKPPMSHDEWDKREWAANSHNRPNDW